MSIKYSTWADDSDSDLEIEEYNTIVSANLTVDKEKDQKSSLVTQIEGQSSGPWAFILSNLSYSLTIDELRKFYK